MLQSTPLENQLSDYGLWVKREDLCSPPPGPPFSKMRGVLSHVKSKSETTIGVLDTYHSQAGWAVAYACSLTGKQCINFYPSYKAEPDRKSNSQIAAAKLGAKLIALPAGRSAILFHQAKRWLQDNTKRSYMMPNALKLHESVAETAVEVTKTAWPNKKQLVVIVPSSSATILAGVVQGLAKIDRSWPKPPTVICHLGYSRSAANVEQYIKNMAAVPPHFDFTLVIIDEGYAYKDKAQPGLTPPWPCDEYYDLKAFRWWLKNGRAQYKQAVFWNIG